MIWNRYVVRAGERVAVWDRNGKVQYVDGPNAKWLFYKSVQPLKQYLAQAQEYLEIHFHDGRREHRQGPTSIWFDPVQHKSIEVQNAIQLDGNEAIVVYDRQDDLVTRRIVRGPAVFVPTESEWLHDFRWHGADPRDSDRKIPRGLHFQKLRVIPDQMYYHVEDVRTSDDALITIKLMIFFELSDIETMLNQTHDPIADFINAVTADAIDFASTRSFEQFKDETESLNELSTYQNLAQRSKRIGYQVNKVVYRGYIASNTLQTMHDGAIETRTKLKLEAETEKQEQELADLRLGHEAERAEVERQMELAHSTHQRELKRLEHEDQLQRTAQESDAKLDVQRRKQDAKLDHRRALNAERVSYLNSVRDMQVDLTRYLVARYQNPDRLIRVVGDGNAQLHLHDDS